MNLFRANLLHLPWIDLWDLPIFYMYVLPNIMYRTLALMPYTPA